MLIIGQNYDETSLFYETTLFYDDDNLFEVYIDIVAYPPRALLLGSFNIDTATQTRNRLIMTMVPVVAIASKAVATDFFCVMTVY